MKLGFTGTRNGMTTAQRNAFGMLLATIRPTEFHHGACKGSDAEAASLVRVMFGGLVKIVAHPGRSAAGGDNEWLDDGAVALSDDVRPTLTHFARNRNIVAACDRLVAAPPGPGRLSSGGTWFTIGHAEKVGRVVTVCWPDGTVSGPPPTIDQAPR